MPDAVASPNVQIEYNYILELGKVVIPLYYRQCDVPMELRTIQRIDFRQCQVAVSPISGSANIWTSGRSSAACSSWRD